MSKRAGLSQLTLSFVLALSCGGGERSGGAGAGSHPPSRRSDTSAARDAGRRVDAGSTREAGAGADAAPVRADAGLGAAEAGAPSNQPPPPDDSPVAHPDAGPVELPNNGEVCDGLDNDHNGKVDDADIEGDGVCDCLKIATLGSGGISSGAVVFADWPNVRAQNPVTALGNRRLTDELLAPYQVIIVLDVATLPGAGNGRTLLANHAFSADEVATFERWVRNGGGVLTTAGYLPDEDLEVENVNRLLAPFGLGYSTTRTYLDGYVESWTPHAITRGVTRVFTANGVEPDGTQGVTLARDTQQHVAMQISEEPGVHIIVWGDEWITYDTQWRATTEQQVQRLWTNMLSWLSPLEPCQSSDDDADAGP